jgi:hypothetical protein
VPRRLDFLHAGGCCLGGGAADDVHEIIGGSAHRMKAFVERCCWLRVSRAKHDELQNMPKDRQLALKLLTDPEHFDLEQFHKVWGRPPTAITAAEVLEALRQLLIERAIV